jgi:hypothetical protein
MPPGSVISYSNHGMQLAGFLVEEVTDLPFDKYIANNILIPLGMEHSSFTVLANLLPCLAKGYYFSDGIYHEEPVEYSRPLTSPAGSLIATADDLGRFMIAQLEGGRLHERRILDEKTCREMQRQQFTNDPRLPGTCYGFYEYKCHNQRAIFHDGDVTGFSSRLFLLPEHRLGFFICNNSGNPILRMEITEQILNHYYPYLGDSVQSRAASAGATHNRHLAGNYRTTRLGLESFDKLEYLSALFQLKDKTLNYFIERESLLFQLPKSNTRIAFREDKGTITHMFIDDQQMPETYEKLNWYESSVTIQFVMVGFFTAVFLFTGIIWPIVKKIRDKKKSLPEQTNFIRYATILVKWISRISLIFIIGFIVSYLLLQDDFAYGVPWIITLFLSIPMITCTLITCLVVFSITLWIRNFKNIKGCIFYTLFTLTCIGYLFYLNYWNLLGFHY